MHYAQFLKQGRRLRVVSAEVAVEDSLILAAALAENVVAESCCRLTAEYALE